MRFCCFHRQRSVELERSQIRRRILERAFILLLPRDVAGTQLLRSPPIHARSRLVLASVGSRRSDRLSSQSVKDAGDRDDHLEPDLVSAKAVMDQSLVLPLCHEGHVMFAGVTGTRPNGQHLSPAAGIP